MNQWIIIPKTELKEVARIAPDKDGLLRALETRFGHNHNIKSGFFILPCRPDEKPAICHTHSSLDWNLAILLHHYIEKLCPRMSRTTKNRLEACLQDELNNKYNAIMHETVRNAVERTTGRNRLSYIKCLEPEEAKSFDELLTFAREKAAGEGLNAIQLFLEGKLGLLMSGDERMKAYDRLSEEKKKALRQTFIEMFTWEKYYKADGGASGAS